MKIPTRSTALKYLDAALIQMKKKKQWSVNLRLYSFRKKGKLPGTEPEMPYKCLLNQCMLCDLYSNILKIRVKLLLFYFSDIIYHQSRNCT